jgi:hypothetical protein
VDKRGPLSDEAYVREVLGEMYTAENILVINDEAHHAWRVPPKVEIAGLSKDELKEATKWVGGAARQLLIFCKNGNRVADCFSAFCMAAILALPGDCHHR